MALAEWIAEGETVSLDLSDFGTERFDKAATAGGFV
jgi:hypothetical protein